MFKKLYGTVNKLLWHVGHANMAKIALKVPQNHSKKARVSGGVHEQRQWVQVVYMSNATVPGGVHEQRHRTRWCTRATPPFFGPRIKAPSSVYPGKKCYFYDLSLIRQ